jgi:hypothetical protein
VEQASGPAGQRETRPVEQASGPAGQRETRPVEEECRSGRRAYGRLARPCERVPGLCQAVRLAVPADGPGWWLRLPNLQPRQRRDQLERRAVPQVGLQAAPRASDAAAQALQPPARVEPPELRWHWVCSLHLVWLAAAAWEAPEVAAQAPQPRHPRAARPSFQTRAGSRGPVWALEAVADPTQVRHPEQAVHWKALEAAETDCEAAPERKQPDRRSAAAMVAEPAASSLAVAAMVAEPAASSLAAVAMVAEPAASAPAAAQSSVTHPVFVRSAVKVPVSAGSAAPVHFSGGSAECQETLRQRQAPDGRQIQEAGRRYSHQLLSRERLGLHAWLPAALRGLLCPGRSGSVGSEHSRRAHLDASPRSRRRG